MEYTQSPLQMKGKSFLNEIQSSTSGTLPITGSHGDLYNSNLVVQRPIWANTQKRKIINISGSVFSENITNNNNFNFNIDLGSVVDSLFKNIVSGTNWLVVTAKSIFEKQITNQKGKK